MKDLSICIPCFNEEESILDLIKSLEVDFPEARIIVFDNNSTDNTSSIVTNNSKVELIYSKKPGKGNVVKHIFREINSPHLLILDGDNTYSSQEMRKLYDEFLKSPVDMMCANRCFKSESVTMRKYHKFGNLLFTNLINVLFNGHYLDVLSGGRVFNSSFYKNVQIKSEGFEVESELSILAISHNYRVREVEIVYHDRAHNSSSKLKTWSDGFKILKMILKYWFTH